MRKFLKNLTILSKDTFLGEGGGRSSPCFSRFSSVFLEIYSKNIKDKVILNVSLHQYIRNFKGPDMGLVASSSRGQFDPLHPSNEDPGQQ